MRRVIIKFAWCARGMRSLIDVIPIKYVKFIFIGRNCRATISIEINKKKLHKITTRDKKNENGKV